MLELSRTVRFCLWTDAHGRPVPADHQPRRNTFSAWPPPRGLPRYYELHVRCAGRADPVTGYFINIAHIDRAVREHALPRIQQALGLDPLDTPLGQLLRDLLHALQPALRHSVAELTLQITPRHSIALRARDMATILLRQQYEFSASHRLHVPRLSDEQNREIFGKCNNPAGHGHNYRLEVVAQSPIDPTGRAAPVSLLDDTVDRAVIQKLDHKHLNLDVPEFADKNPSVENIAATTYDLLKPALAAVGMTLEEISVWETEKTVCTYRGH